MNIREAFAKDADQIARVHVDSWRTTYKGIISDSYLSELSVEKRTQSWLWTFDNRNEHERVYVAEDNEGHVVGFANGGRSRSSEYRYEGELYAIYLLKNYQSSGIGKKLFHSVVESLKANGCSSMMLWVLNDNPSVGFYERQGGQPFGQKTISIGGDSLIELAMGWDRL